MKHAILSASSAHRWLVCTPSARIETNYIEEPSIYAIEGTKAHKVAEYMLLSDEPPSKQLQEEWEISSEEFSEMVECAREYSNYVGDYLVFSERARFEHKVDYSPWVPGGFGTLDFMSVIGNTLHIIDYKYGRGQEVQASNNPQLMLYALGCLSDDIQEIELHIVQPRSIKVLLITDFMDYIIYLKKGKRKK